jgi:insertion element IS1 protein InsB
MDCKYCREFCVKAGKQKNGRQKYFCKHCKKYQQSDYAYFVYTYELKRWIPRLLCNGVGIRGMAKVLKVSANTVIKIILKVAGQIIKPAIPLNRHSFEMDELRTYVGNKENQCWVAYALCSRTKQVIDFVVGKRSKRTLRTVVDTLLLSGVKTIRTDRLNIYQALIPSARHMANAYNINHIERNNLNLRTHLKRLSRRTICFSKSRSMLEACLRIYFWSVVS